MRLAEHHRHRQYHARFDSALPRAGSQEITCAFIRDHISPRFHPVTANRQPETECQELLKTLRMSAQ